MIGGDTMKPINDDRRIPLDAGTHAVELFDVVSGTSDKTGAAYWIVKLTTNGGKGIVFDHFIQCEETEYKTMDKVFKSASSQMDALGLYDTIGECKDHDAWFTKAVDLTYALKGKTIEYTVQDYNFKGKVGTWGKITGFLDTPNDAIQKLSKTGLATDPTASTVDEKEVIPF